jgi:hypothetical protein
MFNNNVVLARHISEFEKTINEPLYTRMMNDIKVPTKICRTMHPYTSTELWDAEEVCSNVRFLDNCQMTELN